MDDLLRELDFAARTMGISPAELKSLLLAISGCMCLAASERSDIIFPALQEELGNMFRVGGDSERSLSYAQVLGTLRDQLQCENRDNPFSYPDTTFEQALEFARGGFIRQLTPSYFFELLYETHCEDEYGAGAPKSHLASRLAAELGASSDSIWEYSLYTGDLPVRLKRLGHPLSAVRCSMLPEDDFFVRLRLAIHGITVDTGGDARGLAELLLINVPFTGNHPVDAGDATGVLDQIFARQETFELAIVAVRAAELTSTGIAETVRQHIVHHRFLHAVVDLGSLRPGKPRGPATSLLVLGGRTPLPMPEVLFINAARLLEEDAENAGQYAMVFVGSLIRLWGEGEDVSFHSAPVRDLGHLRGYFSRHFSNGYRDVASLCKLVPRTDIERAQWSLARGRYQGKAKAGDIQFPKIDSLHLEELLEGRMRHAQPRPVFVIGNNGAGKSALLLQLAKTMSGKGMHTTGIAFGHRDRFPFARTRDMSRFKYLGARTTETSITGAKTAEQIVRLTKIVQTDQVRLDIFRQILEAIGFQCELFILPKDASVLNDGLRANHRSSILALTPIAEVNAELYSKVSLSKTSLGFKRSNATYKVIEINTLSSGEQQLLTLAIKLCAVAIDGMLFLVDEPENSLHVAWQRAIPRMFEIVSTQFGCGIAVATHSPVVISSALEAGLDCFSAHEWALTKIEHGSQQSVDAVLFDNFETYTPHTRRVAERCAYLVADTIRRVNGVRGDDADESAAVDAIARARAIVKASADALPDSLANGDLDLLERARKAIVELLGRN
ncbi:ATP-binding protein [Massilia atriviolacea]